MEAEDESVKPTENNCDWCGKPCRSEKYCCNKCKHEHGKTERKLPILTKSAIGRTVKVLRGIGMICLLILLYCVVALVNVGLNIWLMSVNEPYFWIMQNMTSYIRHVPGVSTSLSATTIDMIRFMPIGTMLFSFNEVIGVSFIVSLLLVCLLSTVVNLLPGQYAFDANCFVLLLGVICFVPVCSVTLQRMRKGN